MEVNKRRHDSRKKKQMIFIWCSQTLMLIWLHRLRYFNRLIQMKKRVKDSNHWSTQIPMSCIISFSLWFLSFLINVDPLTVFCWNKTPEYPCPRTHILHTLMNIRSFIKCLMAKGEISTNKRWEANLGNLPISSKNHNKFIRNH